MDNTDIIEESQVKFTTLVVDFMEESTEWHNQQLRINEALLASIKGISAILETKLA